MFPKCPVCGQTILKLFSHADVCPKCGAPLSTPAAKPAAAAPGLQLPQRKSPSLADGLEIGREKQRHNWGIEGKVQTFISWDEELQRRPLDVPWFLALNDIAYVAAMLSAVSIPDPAVLGSLANSPLPFLLHTRAFLSASYPLLRMNLAIPDNPEQPLWLESGLDIRDGDAQEFFQTAARNESLVVVLNHERDQDVKGFEVEAAGLADLLRAEIAKVAARLPQEENESSFHEAVKQMQQMLPTASSGIEREWIVPLRITGVRQPKTSTGAALPPASTGPMASSPPPARADPASFASDYQGVHYSGFAAVEPFLAELQVSRHAMLRSTFAVLPGQIQQAFAGVTKAFGADSSEAHKLMESLLFCGNCNTAYRPSVLTTLVVPFQNITAPSKCPKCGSQDLILMTNLAK